MGWNHTSGPALLLEVIMWRSVRRPCRWSVMTVAFGVLSCPVDLICHWCEPPTVHLSVSLWHVDQGWRGAAPDSTKKLWLETWSHCEVCANLHVILPAKHLPETFLFSVYLHICFYVNSPLKKTAKFNIEYVSFTENSVWKSQFTRPPPATVILAGRDFPGKTRRTWCFEFGVKTISAVS